MNSYSSIKEVVYDIGMNTNQQHPKVSSKGKGENILKNAYIRHSTKHQGKHKKDDDVDLLPAYMRKS